MSSIISIEKLSFPWQTQDPFLFCAFHDDHYPKGNGKLGPVDSLSGRQIGSDFSGKDGWSMYHGQEVPGFPSHPHKGFETITIAEKGLVDHSDSLGAAGRFGNGDVQWMTAGGGVQHSEMFPLLKEDEENPLLLFQIWLNLPKASKHVPAHFAMLWNEDIPIYKHTDGEGNTTSVKVISGKLGEIVSPSPAPDSFAANADNDVAVWLIEMEGNAQWELPLADKASNRSLYLYEGDGVLIDGQEFPKGYMTKLAANEATRLVNGDSTAKFLFLQGKPIGEPVAQYGPFVMNTNAEIQEAMMQFQRTQFGGWPWPSSSHTHDPARGRFALHADGREEIKD
ncbi:pirin family protein [Roseivirga sp. E12]|uniref:pirin family protein n=1 Tax=Roseivirga sp. E12 TaxID=2819237 RepID=UPI001ABC5646|nr:pirin family protein [Roseivirga sp. E12]MBO3697628.1 pirin family protein [Roseivirga sp. E12]